MMIPQCRDHLINISREIFRACSLLVIGLRFVLISQCIDGNKKNRRNCPIHHHWGDWTISGFATVILKEFAMQRQISLFTPIGRGFLHSIKTRSGVHCKLHFKFWSYLMMKEELPVFAKKELEEYLNVSGSILYSSHNTLRRGDIYLLGFNPGGESDVKDNKLGYEIDNMLSYEKNAYLDEFWNKNKTDYSPLQQRLLWIFDNFKNNSYSLKNICASNLIFLRSRSVEDLKTRYNGDNWSKLLGNCWKVHEKILSIVKPKLIITFGNGDVSPYSYICDRCRGGKEEFLDSGHGSWKIKSFSAQLLDRKVTIVGFPHLSRYSPYRKDRSSKSWIIQLLNEKLES